MRLLVWAYRVLTLFLLVCFTSLTIKGFVPFTPLEAVFDCLFAISCGVLFFLVLVAAFNPRASSKIIATVTVSWCLLFCWWAWIERQSSPFVLHEIHTFDPAGIRLETAHFYRQSVATFAAMMIWFTSFPFVQRFDSARRNLNSARMHASADRHIS